MLSWWWSTLRPWRSGLVLSLLLLLGQILLTLSLVPLASRLEPLLHHMELKTFWYVLALICGVYLAKHTLEYAQQVVLTYITNRWMLQERQYSFDRLLHSDWHNLQGLDPNQNLTILSDDLEKLQQALWSSLHQLFPGVLTLGSLLLVLFWISWPLSLTLLLAVPLATLLLYKTGKHLHREARAQQNAFSQIMQELNESLHNLALIRLYRLEDFRAQSLAEKQQHWFRHRWQTLIWQHLERPLLSSLQIILIALLLGFASWLVSQQHLSGADLLAYATALALAIDPGLWTSESLARLRVSRVSWQRLKSLEHLPRAELLNLAVSQNNCVELQQVSCSFEQHIVLNQVSLSLAPGEKIGLSGVSGSGKSTLLKILAGLHTDYQGQIALPSQWSPHDILLIPQRAALFQTSLRNNICLEICPEPAELENILQICQIESIIKHLPQGLDTLADTRGNWLSGGELQRLALARALLRRPRLLLLDEASSELDLLTEQSIFEALQRYYPETALILVSHRPQSLRSMNRLWHIDKGSLKPGALRQ